MRVIRSGVWVKTVPAKFEPILDGFCFESKSKRLTKNERYLLILRLIKYYFKPSKYEKDHQMIHACKLVSNAKNIKILKVNKRSYTDWRISADGIQIRVPEWIVSDCPSKYIKEKCEF